MAKIDDRCALSRRSALTLAGSFFASAALPKLPSLAGTRDPRLLVVVLRGALDGLAAVMPVGDPDFQNLRGRFGDDVSKAGPPLPLDGLFALNPMLPTLASLYAKREALIVHAAATSYRERSHFDGQEVLESGLPGPTNATQGWLNRAAGHLPVASGSIERGVAFGPSVPLIMRGVTPVLSWAPPAFPAAREDLSARLLSLYQARDPVMAAMLERSDELSTITMASMAKSPNQAGAAKPMSGGAKASKGLDGVLALADGATALLSRSDGPRLGALSIDGWDTHAGEAPGTGRLSKLLGSLDQLIGRLAAGLAPVWRDTVVIAITEFGRTAHINGTEGTDHGTGSVALMFGGGVKGGRVHADWPGLAEAALYEKRDLKPTTDLRAVFKGILAGHLGLTESQLDRVFPGSRAARTLSGLVG